MLSKNRNLLLFIILVVAVGVYFITRQQAKNESNYKTVLFEYDTATIDQIQVIPPGDQSGFVISKVGNRWELRADGKKFTADSKIVKRNLELLNGIKVKRIASRNAEDHEGYAVTPEKRTRIALSSDGKTKGSLLLGKFDYFQPQNAQPDPYGRQPQGEMVFYAALPDDPTVYVVDGQVGFGIGKEVNAFRDKTIVNLDKTKIRQVDLTTSNDQHEKLILQNGSWQLNGQVADSAKMVQYLSKISRQNGSAFSDFLQLNQLPLEKSVTIAGEGFSDVVINAYRKDSLMLLLNSSQNPEAIFEDKDGKILERFTNIETLLQGSENK